MQLTADQRTRLEELIELTAKSRALRHEHENPIEGPKLQELIERHKALSAEKAAAAEVIAGFESETAELTAAIDKQAAQIAKKTTELNDGTGLTSRDLVHLQEEIAAHEAKVAEFEDTELATMERLESAQAEMAGIDTRIAEVTEQGRTTQTAIKERKAALAEDMDELGSQESQLKADLPPELVRRFEGNVAEGGPGAAIIAGPHCQACGQEISGATWHQWLSEDPNEVHTCEECEAVLLRRA
ncbi:hypothetical protein [Brevibacterium sp. XM4083]|uniref:zinc ribbon domain-containing protein n=1 Tax=Brevibacterium sp. XM4083 TaxID=2583238 RepID=UPI001127C73E|nr:hypothetical protein [Brevibacterium sp. XM4083]MCM1012332.1 hypothetical protein [Brevibacterium sp. XM4083]